MTINNSATEYQALTKKLFYNMQKIICNQLEAIEQEYCIYQQQQNTAQPEAGTSKESEAEISAQSEIGKFNYKTWDRDGGGGGNMSIMQNGSLFEKAGVNVSCVYGQMDSKYIDKVAGLTQDNLNFFATGLSIVIHPKSPFVPAVHFNTRYVQTTKWWFGGGMDMTPVFADQNDTDFLHAKLKEICDKRNPDCYDIFKKQCDEYFFLKWRNEPRGVGGIFFEYLNDNFDNEFAFVQNLCNAFTNIYIPIVKQHMYKNWTEADRQAQLIKRSRYVEFNLLQDRGTQFGIMTNGNIEAILMSLPPLAAFITNL